jgi:iron complex outermembrane receptor protein
MSPPDRLTIPVVAVLAWLAAGGAAAQSIDYRALEQMFNEPVTASATGKPQRASEAPANMAIITQDDIRRSGATSIPDVLRFVPGVDVRSYGVANAEVGIRGYNQPYNPRLLVLVNGRQVYSDDYGHVLWAAIPVQMQEIRQIEVIKGPNSALYGFNAVSGVINIITYDPLYDSINSATLRAGTQGELGGAAVATGRIGNDAAVRVSVGGLRARDFPAGRLSASDVAARQTPQVATFALDARMRITPTVQAGLELSLGDSRLPEKGFTGVYDTVFLRTNSLRPWISADTAIGLLSLSAYRNEQNLSIGATGLSALPTWLNENVYVVKASDLVKLGADHTIRVEGEYRNNAITSPGFFRGTVGYQVYAGSLMWNWQISPKISATTAVRIDSLHLNYAGLTAPGSGLAAADYNRAGLVVASFNSGMVYQPTEQDTIRLIAARGVQVPSLADYGLQLPAGVAGPAVISGNPNLHPTIVYNLELDYDRAVPAIDSTLHGAIFVQRNDDLIAQPFANRPAIGPTGLPVVLGGNIGRSDAIGTELALRGHSTSGYRWNLSYAFVTTTDHTSISAAANAVDYARSTPRHVIIASLGYSRERLEIDVMGRWQSSYRDFRGAGIGVPLQPVEVSNYIALNSRIAYQLTDKLTLALTLQQFNTSRALQTAGPPVERRAFVSVSSRF